LYVSGWIEAKWKQYEKFHKRTQAEQDLVDSFISKYSASMDSMGMATKATTTTTTATTTTTTTSATTTTTTTKKATTQATDAPTTTKAVVTYTDAPVNATPHEVELYKAIEPLVVEQVNRPVSDLKVGLLFFFLSCV
jgi:hypothetical protein